MLKYKADIRSVAYIFITTALLIVHWNLGFSWWLFLAQMTMATSCFAMAHNHNHVPMWRSKLLNRATDYWLTLFYGFPPWVWKPTHNLNHHRYNNTVPDYTHTWRYSTKNNIFTFLAYPFFSAVYQQTPTSDYLKMMWKTQRPTWAFYISQYVLLIAFDALFFYIDWKQALWMILIPQQFAVQFVLLINYMQHVHADEESEFNHSRNFDGLGSKFLLNNGLHTAHHEQMGLHWSELPEAHAKLVDKIDPRLNERSLAWFIFRSYVLGIFFKRFRTHDFRAERLAREAEPQQAAA